MLEELKSEIQKHLLEKEILVDDIMIENKNNYNFLTIVLDKVGGIDLDQIVDATNLINPIVDKYEICDDTFIMDVISKERGN